MGWVFRIWSRQSQCLPCTVVVPEPARSTEGPTAEPFVPETTLVMAEEGAGQGGMKAKVMEYLQQMMAAKKAKAKGAKLAASQQVRIMQQEAGNAGICALQGRVERGQGYCCFRACRSQCRQ